jgi:hypothetical protein
MGLRCSLSDLPGFVGTTAGRSPIPFGSLLSALLDRRRFTIHAVCFAAVVVALQWQTDPGDIQDRFSHPVNSQIGLDQAVFQCHG